MTPDPTEPSSLPGSAAELARVLAALELDAYGKQNKVGLCADAARLLREMAADFARYASGRGAHRESATGAWCDMSDPVLAMLTDQGCTCGLDAARAKWRLEP